MAENTHTISQLPDLTIIHGTGDHPLKGMNGQQVFVSSLIEFTLTWSLVFLAFFAVSVLSADTLSDSIALTSIFVSVLSVIVLSGNFLSGTEIMTLFYPVNNIDGEHSTRRNIGIRQLTTSISGLMIAGLGYLLMVLVQFL